MSILELHRLRKEFSSLVAVDDVSFAVEAGHVVGLIGPNGAGKTTLLRMLATLLPPTDGDAAICGFRLRRETLDIRRKIGYLPDFFNLYPDLTLRECLEFFARAYQVPAESVAKRVEAALNYVSLESKADSFIRHLSRGMVQRMGLAAMLVREPQLFLLDEPASGLDPMARMGLRDILRRLSQEGKTIVVSSHILTELSGFCTHIAVMNCGKLVTYGSVEEIERQIAGRQSFVVKVLGNTEGAGAVIRGFDKVELLSACDDTLTLASIDGLEGIAEVNRRLVAAGIGVVELREHKNSLEDLFRILSADKNLHSS